MQDGSVVGDTVHEENGVDRTRSPEREGVAASAQVNEPSMAESISEGDGIGKLTEDCHTSILSCSASQSRLSNLSQDTLVESPSPQLRRSARSTQRRQYPAVSVVIPTRRNNEFLARTSKNRQISSKRRRHRVISDHDRETRRSLYDESSPHSEELNNLASCRSPKRLKRAKGNHSSSNIAVVEECAKKTQGSSDGGMAFTLGETEEIFGRGVLRIQANGPRFAYFMTFLPEVSCHPSMSPEASCEQFPHNESLSERSELREKGRRKSYTPIMSSLYEKQDRRQTKMLQSTLSRGSDKEAHKKPIRRLRWSSEEVNYLKELRRDGRRRWSDLTRAFLDRYPARSPAAIQVYCSTHGL